MGRHGDGESGKHDITIGNPKAANKSGGRKAGDTGCARNEPEQPSQGLVERARVIARKARILHAERRHLCSFGDKALRVLYAAWGEIRLRPAVGRGKRLRL